MISHAKNLVFLVVFSCVSLLYSVAGAQDVSPSHDQAARKAIAATRATEPFDNILPQASAQLKNQLTANNPDQAERIAVIVDEEALALASRRGALEQEAVRLFVTTFSEAELNEISGFFTSEAGKKYLDNTPILARELGKAARVWANGVNRDLAKAVSEKFAAGN